MKRYLFPCLLALLTLIPARAHRAEELFEQYGILMLRGNQLDIRSVGSGVLIRLSTQRFTTLHRENAQLRQRNTLAEIIQKESPMPDLIRVEISTGQPYEFIFTGGVFFNDGIRPAILEEHPLDLGTDGEFLFEFGGKSYALRTSCNQDDGIYTPTDFRITLSDETTGISQLLVEIPQLFYTVPQVWWIDDIDCDGVPDLILQESRNAFEYNWVLYLSTYAGADELVRAVAAHRARVEPE